MPRYSVTRRKPGSGAGYNWETEQIEEFDAPGGMDISSPGCVAFWGDMARQTVTRLYGARYLVKVERLSD